MMKSSVEELNDIIKRENTFIEEFFTEIEKVIVGQRYLLERFLIGLLANGHILIEGVPGLAKTMAVRTFSSIIHSNFQRIQFTPDMLPADLTGTPIYDQSTGNFTIRKGPIFSNIILADEINRAPAKVQSALLEVMEERQVTIGETTFHLESPFLVLATQNPIEQDGTYSLPESQLDRFMLKVKVTYPTREEEHRILKNMSFTDIKFDVKAVLTPVQILKFREIVDQVFIDEKVEHYILDIVEATRNPLKFQLSDLKGMIEFGASPRASINLSLASKAHAFIQGRGYVTPQDVKAIAMDVLQHRIIPTYHADSEERTADKIIQLILDRIEMK